ncbi:lipid-A-disaccharide synthase [Kovacikia minuta CCNUW1]|nr:lipid-A-disaccharide synthase [Kovacikia minuta]UBF29473.1 lipid-A-disaccharide synthase [Kovacikia minuta CCNUW1]
MRIFISTGEVSGDLQGSLLIAALKRQAEKSALDVEVLGLGGDRMAAAGAEILADTSAIGSMGILESLPFVLPTLKVQRLAKQSLKQHPPDLVVLIDYMGPNIPFCEYLSQHFPQIPLVYYISPQDWVWGDQWKWGVRLFKSDRIINSVDRILAIFPEEFKYYQRKGGKVTWVGHPLIDRMQTAPDRERARAALGIPAEQTAVVLFPASRQQEIKYLMPAMFEAAQQIQAKLPQVHFWIPLALEKYRQPIQQAVQQYGLQATLLTDALERPTNGNEPDTAAALQAIAAADLAITKSGTVNLEIALLNIPQVVLYKLNPFTGWIVHRLLRFYVPFISPTNLVEMKPIVKEFLQFQATPEAIAQESLELLLNPNRRQKMLAEYQQMQQALGAPGVCDRAAGEIFDLLEDSRHKAQGEKG